MELHWFWLPIGLAVALILFGLPVFSPIEKRNNHSNNIDGVRFFLASFVVFDHIDLFRTFFLTGKWAAQSPFYSILGSFGVSIFFMITAFLFWGKIKSSTNWLGLYSDRFFRIAPVYTCVITAMVVLAFIISHEDQLTKINLYRILQWYDFGLNVKKPNINSLPNTMQLTAGVTWTLAYEWAFYFSLPVLALLTRRSKESALLLLFLTIYILPLIPTYFRIEVLIPFAIGIVCYEFKDAFEVNRVVRFLVTVFCILAIFLFDVKHYSVFMQLYLGIIFMMLLKGETLLGLLVSRPAIRLGHASYSIYLWQGIIFYPAFKFVIKENDILNDQLSFWCACIISYLLLCLVSYASYMLIEHPFITLGKKLKNKFIVR